MGEKENSNVRRKDQEINQLTLTVMDSDVTAITICWFSTFITPKIYVIAPLRWWYNLFIHFYIVFIIHKLWGSNARRRPDFFNTIAIVRVRQYPLELLKSDHNCKASANLATKPSPIPRFTPGPRTGQGGEQKRSPFSSPPDSVLPGSISSASLEDLFTGGGGDSERNPFGFSPLGFPSDFGASSVGEPWAEVEMGGRAICSRFFSVGVFFSSTNKDLRADRMPDSFGSSSRIPVSVHLGWIMRREGLEEGCESTCLLRIQVSTVLWYCRHLRVVAASTLLYHFAIVKFAFLLSS